MELELESEQELELESLLEQELKLVLMLLMGRNRWLRILSVGRREEGLPQVQAGRIWCFSCVGASLCKLKFCVLLFRPVYISLAWLGLAEWTYHFRPTACQSHPPAGAAASGRWFPDYWLSPFCPAVTSGWQIRSLAFLSAIDQRVVCMCECIWYEVVILHVFPNSSKKEWKKL